MIGVLSNGHEREIVAEFFELFKTPWEYYDSGRRHYDVLLVTERSIPATHAPLVISYGCGQTELDSELNISVTPTRDDRYAMLGNTKVPLYGGTATFAGCQSPLLLGDTSALPMGYETSDNGRRIIRLGYDLFEELELLLTQGQPPQNAGIAALDLHIAMIRDWMVESGLRIREIPAVPEGHGFIACLTHDVDFIGIKRHFWDHSLAGFLYRATWGSLKGLLSRKMNWSQAAQNWQVALSLPLIWAGIGRDPWDQFDHFERLENEIPSTFYFMPFKNRAGQGFENGRQRYRASRYDVADAAVQIQGLLKRRCEVGVHGIDAWHDPDLGRQELAQIEGVCGEKAPGIRMHWLCLEASSFAILDRAGFAYDSSVGYNETVGFRAGTGQVYKPPGSHHLLELPMHIQDVALFQPGKLNLSPTEADQLCENLIQSVEKHKGVVTVLWHQRSLGPERLWGDFYSQLIGKLKARNAWLATAADVVAWFRMRRAAKFMENGEIRFSPVMAAKERLPPLML